MPKPLNRYIIAKNLDRARVNCEIDWGWPRVGEFRWTDPQGATVRYVNNIRELYGYRDTVVYLGDAWQESDAVRSLSSRTAEELLTILRSMNMTVSYSPLPPGPP